MIMDQAAKYCIGTVTSKRKEKQKQGENNQKEAKRRNQTWQKNISGDGYKLLNILMRFGDEHKSRSRVIRIT